MAGLPTNSKTNTQRKQEQALQQWHNLFETYSARRSAEAHRHWQEVRRLGLPQRKHEHWKYTPLDGLLAHEFVLPKAPQVDRAALDALALPVDCWRLVFIDGVFNEQLSDTQWGLIRLISTHRALRANCLPPSSPRCFCT